jgi:membrane protein required for colicin V production
MTPHALDLAIGLVILLSTLVAYFRGIVREFFMLAGLALATFVAYSAGHLLVPDVSKWLGTLPNSADEKPTVLSLLKPTVATDVVAYGGLFLAVFVLMVIIRMMISHWVSGAGLTVADRVGGALFGFLRGYLLVLIVFATCLYMAYAGETDQLPEWAKNSISVPILESTLAWTNKNIDIKTSLKTIANKLEKINFDKVGKEAGNAATELKDEVKKEEVGVQKAPETPPAPAAAPVAPVAAAPVSAPPSTPPSGPPAAAVGKAPPSPGDAATAP